MITLPKKVKKRMINDFTGKLESQRRQQIHDQNPNGEITKRTRRTNNAEKLYRKELERLMRIFVSNIYLSEDDLELHVQKIPISQEDYEFLINRIKVRFKEF